MILTVVREPSQGGRTWGRLVAEDGHRICHSLEDEVREIEGVPVSEWKIKGNTAIPSGVYKVTLEFSPRFGPDTMTIHDVPGFTHIRIHAGNTVKDTEGCILLGMQRTPVGIAESRPAITIVREMVRKARDDGETVWIDIQNATEKA